MLAAVLAAAVAIVIGAAVLHLRGTYFAVLTFGMTELIRHAITYFEKRVTGTVGRLIAVVPEPDTVYLTVLVIAAAAVATSIVVRAQPLRPRDGRHRRRRAARRRRWASTRGSSRSPASRSPRPSPARWARR